MAVGVIAKETYRDMHASLNEVSHQITSDVALRNKSSSGAGGAKHPEGTDSHSICERAGGAKRTGLRGWQTGIGKAHGQIPEIGNSRLETGPPIGPAQTISDGLRSPRPQRPRNAGVCAGHDEVSDFRECVAGAGGFEPPDGGIKIRCLTTWLRPNASQGSNGLGGKRADNSSGSPAPQWPSRTKFAPAEGSPHTPNTLNQEQCLWSRDAAVPSLKGQTSSRHCGGSDHSHRRA